MQSVQNFVDTGGLGVGLGSSRSNGLIFAVMGQLGVIGLVCFSGFLATSFLRPFLVKGLSRTEDSAAALFRASRTAAFSSMFAALVSGTTVDPGLIFVTYAALATAAYAAAQERSKLARGQATTPQPNAPRPAGPQRPVLMRRDIG